ncbi:MAG: hypothetical protein ACRDDY_06245 [Clostridium sp.]|uniref:hypothetical protein n=1 Tax=Clostridium sp. TaxID=1506 RepID=UPI003EE7B3E6
MLVLPNNGNSGDGSSCDVNKNYVDSQLLKKLDITVFDNKMEELEKENGVIFETVEG